MDKLQTAILEAIKGIVAATDKQVSYEVYTSIDKTSFLKKDIISKTNIIITISDPIIDTKSQRNGFKLF